MISMTPPKSISNYCLTELVTLPEVTILAHTMTSWVHKLCPHIVLLESLVEDPYTLLPENLRAEMHSFRSFDIVTKRN